MCSVLHFLKYTPVMCSTAVANGQIHVKSLYFFSMNNFNL